MKLISEKCVVTSSCLFGFQKPLKRTFFPHSHKPRKNIFELVVEIVGSRTIPGCAGRMRGSKRRHVLKLHSKHAGEITKRRKRQKRGFKAVIGRARRLSPVSLLHFLLTPDCGSPFVMLLKNISILTL